MNDQIARRAIQALHVVSSTRRRGAEIFAVDLDRALNRRGIPGEVLALGPGGDLAVDALCGGRFRPTTVRDLRRAARGSDVVVAHGSSTLLACATTLAGVGVPFVYRSIGDPDHWVDTRARSVRVGLMLRRAARIVALWPAARSRLIERYGLRPEEVVAIPNGVETKRFASVTAAERTLARLQFGLDDAYPVACIVGSLTADKDPLTAISAAALVPGLQLLVAGDGPLRFEAETLAATRMPGRATFLSAVADVRPVLAASDALVLASQTEGLPAVLIEAGLSGLPVVATDVGGVSEVVIDGVTGVLVPPRSPESISTALGRALETGTFGPSARTHCMQQFSMDAVAERWYYLLTDVAGSRRTGSDG